MFKQVLTIFIKWIVNPTLGENRQKCTAFEHIYKGQVLKSPEF